MTCRQFNAEVPDAPTVRYFSVAAEHDGRWVSPEWQLPYRIVRHLEGPNDGVVSLASARYGESFEVWEGDHLSLINQLTPAAQLRPWTERTGHYGRIVRRLADEGF
jgi:triacylglycerol lipase